MIEFPKLVRDILATAGAPIGNKIKKPFQLPSWIKEGTLEIKRAFLQALFDDEATVKIKSREILLRLTKTVELSDNLHQFLHDIKIMLEEFDIKGATITNCRQGTTANGEVLQKGLRICGSFNFINFQKNIGFLHSHKKRALCKMVKNIQKVQCRIGENKKKIIELLKNNHRLNTLEIARMSGLQHLNTLLHLTELEKRNKVRRMIPSVRSKPHIWLLNSN